MRLGDSISCPESQSGFTYLGILVAVVVVGIVLAQAGILWSQAAQREKEQELLFDGHQFRQAIALYYQRTPGPIKHYPKTLGDLVEDRRYNPSQHYLRKIYVDPFSNSPEWGLLMAPEGGIKGVHSLSHATPIKRSGFDDGDKAFEKAKSHADWLFGYDPKPAFGPRPMP